ncbi:MAG: IS21 family transposase [Oscillospiraceae bacterium]|nr:IS21 family transposase [Oscillospiraceae bacterium]
MIDYREIIRLKTAEHSNTSVASSTGNCRSLVADVWARAQKNNLFWPLPSTLTNEVLKQILYPERQDANQRMMPDYEYIHKELAKPGVTLTLLWSEYCSSCEQAGKIPYQHTQFNELYHSFAATYKATLRLKHKPGDQMQVDWVGDTLHIFDPVTEETTKAYIFVACLPCSMYGYAEAFPDMKTPSWLNGHIHAFEFFGGVPRITVPDNCKTSTIKNTKTEVILNQSYREMAEHYGTTIIPARPLAPRDKAAIEGSVRVIETWVLASLRSRKFFSFEELNIAIRDKMKEYNERPFQKRKGSRLSAFEEEEKEFLMPLPATPYESAVWSKATIQPDYLINIGDVKYSVPHDLIGKEVDIRATDKVIEVFYHQSRVASHVRVAYSPDPVYNLEHMPVNHRKYLQYDTDYYLEWAESIGDSTLVVTKGFLYGHKVEQHGYKSCSGLMKLADKYTPERLERACERALSYTPQPSIKNVTTILQNGQDKLSNEKPVRKNSGQYGITRGSSYYKGGDHL